MIQLPLFNLPDWLRLKLLGLNFQIFTWELNIGDWILEAVDTLTFPINATIGGVNSALAWIEQAWYWVSERIHALTDPWVDEIIRISGNVATWWDSLGDWWTVRWGEITDAIESGIDDLQSWAGELLDGVNAWISRVEASLGLKEDAGIAQVLIAAALSPWRDLFNFWGGFGSEASSFFSDPFSWLEGKFADWFDTHF